MVAGPSGVERRHRLDSRQPRRACTSIEITLFNTKVSDALDSDIERQLLLWQFYRQEDAHARELEKFNQVCTEFDSAHADS
jgi:hypothetical protein